MHAVAHSWSGILIRIVTFCILAASGTLTVAAEQTYQRGWSHNCKLSCTNVSVNQPETVERPGRTTAGTACLVSKEACEAGRAAACAEAVATTNNETLYDDCRIVAEGEGECMQRCTLR
jgi:hypothetical protein